MTGLRYLSLALTGALILAACGSTPTTPGGTGSNNGGTGGGTGGGGTGGGTGGSTGGGGTGNQVELCASLTVNLQGITVNNGVPAAPIVIKDASGNEVFSGTAVSGQKLSTMFPAGAYSVNAGPLQGYEATNSPQSVTLDCTTNNTKSVTLTYKTTQVVQKAVASVAFNGDTPVTDAMGAALPGQQEANINKNVMLYAAQTEEPVLVEMIVRDASGAPVSGARVNVSVDSPNVTIVAGHTRQGTTAAPLSLKAQAVLKAQDMSANSTAFSDADGLVRFTVYATSTPGQNVPAKIVVSASAATDAPTSTALAEFKMFFVNMSHLYYYGDGSMGVTGQLIDSKRRVGGTIGSFENNWFDLNQRTHAFSTVAFTKQPQTGPFPVGGGQENAFPGYVVYTLTGDNLFLTTNSSSLSGSKTVTADNGQNVYLIPNRDLTADQLPLSGNIRAQYYYQVRYGNTTYNFLLKDYTFTKTFTGSQLAIEKTGPNIITWTGFLRTPPNAPTHNPYAPDDVTLPPRLDRDNFTSGTTEDNFTVGKTYTYQIRIRNTSGTVARNVTARDELPAELGYVLGSARIVDATGNPTGGALNADYDLNTHTIDFNSLGDLAAGGELRIAIDVYARQKPGYAWDDNNRDGISDRNQGDNSLQGAFGITPPEHAANLNTEYEDPYDIKNHAKASADNAAEVHAYKYINVVRPVARITKTSPQAEVVTNRQALFNIRVDNFDRSTVNELDARIRQAYADLKSRFPDEYKQEGFLYNARIEDTYGSAFSGPVLRDEAGNILPIERFDQAGNNDRRIGYNLGTLLNGTTRTFTLSLRGEVVGSQDNLNCVRLFAWNLNQLYRGNRAEYLQFEGPQNDTYPTGSYALDRGRNFLESCAAVQVVGKPAWGHDLWDNYIGLGEFFRDTLTDAYSVGSQYVYDMYYENEGENTATNVFINAALPGMANLINSQSIIVVFRNQDGTVTRHVVDLRDRSTWSFMASGSTITVVPAPDNRSFRFHVDKMDVLDRISVEFQVVASQKGDDFFTTKMTWDQGDGRTIVDNEHTYITD